MGAILKFPTKSRIIVFDKNEEGRWLCDGKFAFFCHKSMTSEREFNIDTGIYEKHHGDLHKTLLNVSSFDSIQEISRSCTIPAKLEVFSEGIVIIRYGNLAPDDIKGDNYVVKYEDSNETTKHLLIPTKIIDYYNEFLSLNSEIYISPEEGNIVITSTDYLKSVSGLEVDGKPIFAIFRAKAPIYDATSIL